MPCDFSENSAMRLDQDGSGIMPDPGCVYGGTVREAGQSPANWSAHPWVAEGGHRIRFGLGIVGCWASWSVYFDWVHLAE